MLVQVYLKKAKEPLYITYPQDYKGVKSGGREDSGFSLTTTPRFLTPDEIVVANSFIDKLDYVQSLVKTGCVLGGDSQIPNSNAGLDIFETDHDMTSSAKVGSTRRTLKERKAIVAEALAN